MNEDGSLVVMW